MHLLLLYWGVCAMVLGLGAFDAWHRRHEPDNLPPHWIEPRS